MSLLRSLSASLLSATFCFAVVTSSACSTEADGIGDCREIELARCKASKPCGVVQDVSACERYYRDHCLHGLTAPAPPQAQVGACVNVIEAAGRCAEADPDINLEDCDPAVTAPHPGLSLLTACDVVAHPERADECAFLLPSDAPDDGGSAGAAGQSAGGSSGD